MDEKKRKLNKKSEGRIIEIGEALEKKERKERIARKRAEKAARPSLGKRILSLMLVAVLVLSAVILTVFWDRVNFDAIRRSFAYMGTEQTVGGATIPFSYEHGNSNYFAALGKNLVHVSNHETVIYDRSGTVLFQTEFPLETPAVVVGGGVAAAYDIGGRNLMVFNEKGTKMEVEIEEDLGIYSAALNRSGWLAVTCQKKGQKGCVDIYNANMNKVFSYDSASRYVINAYVSEDCKYMVAQTLGQRDGGFISEMVVYRLDSDAKHAVYSVDAMVLSVDSIDQQILCISDSKAVVASSSGQVKATYEYPLPYLREYSADGDGFAVFTLNRHRAGTSGKLITVAGDGHVLAELDISDEILDLSAAGRYIAVLYADRLVVYNKDLTEYAQFGQTDTAEFVCMRSDGSVWLIETDEISVLIP